MKHPEFTIREYARVERVDQRTVRRWIQKGAVPFRKTPGGGVRIPRMTNTDNPGHAAK